MLKVLITTRGVGTMKMNALDKVGILLLVVGGFNWGLVGVFKYNLVDEIFGVESGASRVIYTLVGVASIYGLLTMMKIFSSNSKS